VPGNPNRPLSHPAVGPCHRTRLAESGVAAVDVCSCGMLQLHLGPMTLRMTPEALSELLGTLGEAVAQAAGRRVRGEASLELRSFRTKGNA
jgi:hypothetical protein